MMGIHKHLIRQFLIAGIMDKGLVKSSTIGMPQGRTAFSNPIKYILRKKAVARPIGKHSNKGKTWLGQSFRILP